MTTRVERQKIIEGLKELGAPPAILKTVRRRLERVGANPYHIVVRKPDEVRGTCWVKVETMKHARKVAEKWAFASPVGTTIIIYLQCPSMPLDARYYFVTKNGVLESRSRVYSTEYRKWLKEYGFLAEARWHKENGWDKEFVRAPRPQQYNDRWNLIRSLMDAQLNQAKSN